MTSRALFSLLGVLAVFQTTPASSGLILGSVIDAGTGQGISGAAVSLELMPSPSAPGAAPRPPREAVSQRLITGDRGRFLFRDLPAGRYVFSANAVGYLSGGRYGVRRLNGPGQEFELVEGAQVRDVTLRLWKSAGISGRVLDDTGESVVQATVQFFSRATVRGRPTLGGSVSSASTDDRGIYRTGNLTPGDYLVAVTTKIVTAPVAMRAAFEALGVGRPQLDRLQELSNIGAAEFVLGSGAGFRIGDYLLPEPGGGRLPVLPPTSDGRLFAFPTTFHPAALTPADAVVVSLGSGELRSGVDLTIRATPTVRVSGTVRGPDGPAKDLPLRLVPSHSLALSADARGSFDAAMTATDSDGRFTFLGVPPGAYVVQALQPPRGQSAPSSITTLVVNTPTGTVSSGTSTAGASPIPMAPTLVLERSLTVGQTNLTGLDLELTPATRLTGSVVFQGVRERPSPEAVARVSISIQMVEGHFSTPFGLTPKAETDKSGNFRTNGLVPGKYIVRPSISVAGWVARSAMWQGHNLLDDPIDSDGSDLIGVIITFTDQITQMSGAVSDAAGRVDSTASVLMFPADRSRWSFLGPRLARLVRVSSAGAYSIPNVSPGAYFVLAIDDATIADWQDPKQLEALSRVATRLTLVEGEQRVLDLKTAAVR